MLGRVSAERPERTLQFSGLTWNVRNYGGGPGPNNWSDSAETVWVDENGWLHLKIQPINGVWHSSELYTSGCATYGLYRFDLIGRIDQLDPNVVFAPFLYGDATHEIDIEFAKWGYANNDAGQYVIQPYTIPTHITRFPIALEGTYTTHSFDWQPTQVNFESWHGHQSGTADPSLLINRWQYVGNDIPLESDCLKLHINLWQFEGRVPSDQQEVEMVVARVETPANRVVTGIDLQSAESKPVSHALLQPIFLLLLFCSMTLFAKAWKR